LKDFTSYLNNGECEKDKENLDSDTLGMFRTLADKYEGVTEDEMIKNIFAEAEKNRKAGKLNDAEIDNFVNIITPFLDSKQKKLLEKVVTKLKSNKKSPQVQ